MRTRLDLEDIEIQTLASYANKSRDSRGRMQTEDEHPYRTAFSRDRDRIVHTSAFRRLEYKTQVFVNHEGDYYRTRLTHTLEVAQIGRTIAQTLGVNETLTETICIAHDLGHTPFGHSGQDVMAELMRDHGGFEHNKQSFRIVTVLENPYPGLTGLNLSYEVLEGIMKHASEYDMPDGSTFIKGGYPSIESQIGNFADEIAYNNHDIDDGLKSGLINYDGLKEVELWQTHFERIVAQNKHTDDKQLRRLAVRAIINYLVTDLVTHTAQCINQQKIKTPEDVREHGKDLVGFSPEAKRLNSQLKKFLFANMYRHYRVERMAEKARRVITQLFTAYRDNPNTIPPDFRKFYGNDEKIERVVCDYIAGMTDRYALEEYSKLFDPFARV